MKRVESFCPSCSGEVEFKVSSSLVTVCEYCETVVARGDMRLEDFGKVARITPQSSPFELGMTGTYQDKSFEIVGHIQYSHAAGGVWDEWYASFGGDRWGWVSEAQGKIHIVFPQPIPEGDELPEKGNFALGQVIQITNVQPLTVVETGVAQVVAAEGEMPFVLKSGAEHDYVDLHGEGSTLATIEFGDQEGTTLFLGQEASTNELGLSQKMMGNDADVVEIDSHQVSCPNCGGSLALQAPDQIKRVVCPFCQGVLDADQGKLQYLSTLEVKKSAEPVIEIGTKGHLRGEDYTVIGFMQRSVTYDRKYYWTEYLLFNSKVGFRWLVHSDDHWSFAETISIGDIRGLGPGFDMPSCRYGGQRYLKFQKGRARVEYVLGEFTWKVEIGEKVEMSEYVAAPKSISIERSVVETVTVGKKKNKKHKKTKTKVSQEANCTLAHYLPHAKVERAFNLEPLSRGWGIAPNQPLPFKMEPIIWSWLGFIGILFGIVFLDLNPSSEGAGLGWLLLALFSVSIVPGAAWLYRASLISKRWSESEFKHVKPN